MRRLFRSGLATARVVQCSNVNRILCALTLLACGKHYTPPNECRDGQVCAAGVEELGEAEIETEFAAEGEQSEANVRQQDNSSGARAFACSDTGECALPTPICDPATDTCVQCMSVDDCPLGQVCLEGNRCGGCVAIE